MSIAVVAERSSADKTNVDLKTKNLAWRLFVYFFHQKAETSLPFCYSTYQKIIVPVCYAMLLVPCQENTSHFCHLLSFIQDTSVDE